MQGSNGVSPQEAPQKPDKPKPDPKDAVKIKKAEKIISDADEAIDQMKTELDELKVEKNNDDYN